MSDAVPEPNAPVSYPRIVLKGIFGGTLMGLANLVPGISGGTMLLAAGIYPRFIQAISEVTRFRFRGPYWQWRLHTAFGRGYPPKRELLASILEYGRWIHQMRR